MKCIICDSDSSYYFSKTYSEAPFNEFMREIGTIDYYKCKSCGFVLSKTHCELEEGKWNNLNSQFHHYLERSESKKTINQPPYIEQAMMLSLLGNNEIISIDSMLDYAAGYGVLSHLLDKYYSLNLPIFDLYVQDEISNRYIHEDDLKTYKTVINSAMFEHVLRREDLDRVNNLVDTNGCLILHTVICENIPNDPDWFYLTPPVHTAFHTNKSMEILMGQWGFSSSIYCPQSKCWVLLKNNIDDVENKVTRINQELQCDWLYWKKGFVDYWKGF